MFAERAEEEHIIIRKITIDLCTEKSQNTGEFSFADNTVLHGVIDLKFLVAVLVESRKYNHENRAGYEEDGNIWDFVIPMAVLVAIAIITGDLLLAVVLAIACCALMYLPNIT